MSQLHAYQGHLPEVHASAYVAAGAQLIGRVRLGAESSVWFNAVLRADEDEIHVGARSNIQDGCVIHADAGMPTWIGEGVTVGHGAVVHACHVGDGCMIGMHAVVLTGARLGAGCLVGAQALVTEGKEIPAGHLVLGVPGRAVRPLLPEEIENLKLSAEHYAERARRYRRELIPS